MPSSLTSTIPTELDMASSSAQIRTLDPPMIWIQGPSITDTTTDTDEAQMRKFDLRVDAVPVELGGIVVHIDVAIVVQGGRDYGAVSRHRVHL